MKFVRRSRLADEVFSLIERPFNLTSRH